MNTFPGLPRSRAARIAYFEARIAARERADALCEYKVLFRLALPDAIEFASKLSDYHETKRRACVLRAWCAQKLGWRSEVRVALVGARFHAHLARTARKEGR